MRWSEAVARPTDRQLQQFAWCGGAVLLLLAARHVIIAGHPIWSAAYVGGAMLLALVGVLKPRWLAPIFTAWMIAVFPVAWMVSTVVLGLIFFGLFTPLALVFRLIGRDALHRRVEPGETSYWRDKPAAKDVRSYLKQF
jgi:hypothetical protein